MRGLGRVGVFAAVALATGCGRIGFDALGGGDGGGGGGGEGGPADAACALGPWSTPQDLVEINSANDEYSPALSADGLDLILQTNRPGGLGGYDLFEATRMDVLQPWGTPMPMANVNGATDDEYPGLSHDALTLYYISDRTGPLRLYVTTRPTRTSPFAAPTLVAPLSLASYKGPSLSADGTELFLTTLGANEALSRVTGYATGNPVLEPQTSLDISMKNGFSTITGDGLTLFWESDASAAAATDIYTATRPAIGAPFGAASEVTELNVPNQFDGDPEISFDGRTMLLYSLRNGGLGASDIFIATRACL